MSGRPIFDIIGDLERLLGEDDVSNEALKTRVHRIWSSLVGDPSDSSLSLPQMVAQLDETALGHSADASATNAAKKTLDSSRFAQSTTTPTSIATGKGSNFSTGKSHR